MSNRSRIIFRFFFAPLLCIFIYLLIIFFASTIVSITQEGDYLEHEGLIYLLTGIGGVIAFSIWFVVKKRMNLPSSTWDLGKPVDWSYMLIGALAMLGFTGLYFFVITNIESSAIQEAIKSYEELTEVKSATRADLYMNLIGTCLLIPVLEEMIFRGCVLEGMLECRHPWLAIIFSSLFFGAMHGQIIQIIYAATCGIALGCIYYYTKNIVMAIMAHILFNILGSGIYLLFSISDEAYNIINYVYYVFIPAFVIFTVFMARKRQARFSDEKSGEADEVISGRDV